MAIRLRKTDGRTDVADHFVDARGTEEGAAHVAEQYPDSEQMKLLTFISVPLAAANAVTELVEVDGAQSITLFLRVTATGDAGIQIVLEGSNDGTVPGYRSESPLPTMAPLADQGAGTAYYMVARSFCAKYVRLRCITLTGSGTPVCSLVVARIYWRP
jgi:hypothetical protein